MRFARFAFALILSTSLILCLCFSAHAAADESPMTIHCANTLYHGQQGFDPYSIERAYYDIPTSSGVYQFSIPGTIMENQREYEARSINILGYPDIELWQQGYIYTFMYEIRVQNYVVPQPDAVVFTFGVATLRDDDYISIFQALGDVIHTYSVSNTMTTYYVTSTVYVDESFKGHSVGNLDEAYCSLEMSVREQAAVTLNVRLSNVKAQKAIGEDAYYQASVDALNDLNSSMNGVNNSVNQVNNSVNEVNSSVNEVNQTLEDLPEAQVDAEYNFILNTMPDDQGYIDTISGDLTIMHDYFVGKTDSLVFLLDYLESSRPCMYLPKVSIPFFKNLNIFDDQIFYFDTYLDSMNSDIMPKVDIVVIGIRLFLSFTFFTTTIWKMSRMEWWL